MPSLIKPFQGFKRISSTLILSVACSTLLLGCGSDSNTTINSNPQDTNNSRPATDPKSTITAIMPMHIIDGQLTIQLSNSAEPIYNNTSFTGFSAEVSDIDFKSNRDALVLITLSGDDKTMMYDPILNKYVPFNGKVHHLAPLPQTHDKIYISPVSEAIYQRTVIRSNQLDVNTVDLSLLETKYLNKAKSEINSSLSKAFDTNLYPYFSTSQSISSIRDPINPAYYDNLFLGMGLLEYWANEHPNTINTYLEFAHNFAVDLRDGYLNGRTIKGDNTPFTTIPPSPLNYNPQDNTLLGIGAMQKTSREYFGEKFKTATLSYARKAFQSTFNPLALDRLSKLDYYTKFFDRNSTTTYRWVGAGDYRPALGLTHTESCSNGLNPCRQGLNADDVTTRINDVEYLIGTHKLNQCDITFYPHGEVTITRGDKTYRSSINRDLADNLQQINNDPQNYILNVGASENKPAYFLQFEIKDLDIVKARTGYNTDIYPIALEDVEMDCSI